MVQYSTWVQDRMDYSTKKNKKKKNRGVEGTLFWKRVEFVFYFMSGNSRQNNAPP